MKHQSTEGFQKRTETYFAATTKAAKQWYDEEGNWVSDSLRPATRERFWLAFSPYATGDHTMADAIIRKGEISDAPEKWGIFSPNIASALLAQHRDTMAADVQSKLERLVETAFGFYPGNRQPDFIFQGYNDNMPAKASMGLILGGEMLGNPDAVEYGVWNLHQLRAMLVRSGINSEFNSPTYTPLTLHALGEIGEYAKNEEARELARGLESRLWLDLAARFHPEMGSIAGPHSRAYTTDTLANLSLVSALLWFHFGDQIHPSPMEVFAMPKDLVIHHGGDVPFNTAQFSWLAAGSFHIPDAALDMFQSKSYPFEASASYEIGGPYPDSPARTGSLKTRLTSDYTLGTATTPKGGGEQTMSYFVTYRRNKEIRSFRDVGTVFSKIVLDDDVPGMLRTPKGEEVEDPKNAKGYYGEADLLTSRANTLAFQDQNSALILTHPHPGLGGGSTTADKEPRVLKRLSELVIFPSHFGGVEELIVGGKKREVWEGEVPRGEWVVARRGRLLIGIRPMVYSHSLGPVPITLEKVNKYEVLRSTYYQGEPRTFDREELRLTFGGFAAEHASVDDYSSLEEFAAFLSQARFTDYLWLTRKVRYRRPGNAQTNALDAQVSWTQGMCTPSYVTINGRRIPSPVVEIDGLQPDEFPFLTDEFRPVPPFFPWKDFKNIWYDVPYAIGDRET